jgi:hypothetical protein
MVYIALSSTPEACGRSRGGLARNAAEYKQHLMNCDSPRRNDLDGRGALSEGSAGGIYHVLPENVSGPGSLHGTAGAAPIV